MYLHLIDDARAVNHFIRRTRLHHPESHHFLVFTNQDRLTFVEPGPDLSIFRPGRAYCTKLAGDLHRYKAVFVHNLTYEKSRVVLEASKEVVFVWCIWGHDYYHTFPQLFGKLFLPYTRTANALLGKMSLTALQIQYLVDPLTRRMGLGIRGQFRRDAAARIHYSCNTLNRHSEVFQMVPIPESQRFHLAYYSIENISEGFDIGADELGPHILVGNSASNTSNHLDIFFRLRRHSTHRKLIVILGYGSGRYRKLVNMAGRWLFGGRYQPINKALPIDQYNRILMDCNVMIYNHRRAQALGNILFGLWAGHKIYLREENPVYAWLTEMGLRVYSIQAEWPTGDFTPLTAKWRSKNREIIEQHYSEASLVRDLDRMLDYIQDINLRE